MDNQIQQEDLFDVEVDSIAKKHILDIVTWAKIVAITAFISYGLSLVVAIFGNSVSEGGFATSTGRASTIAGTLVVVIIGVILNIFLFKFAKDAKNGVEYTNQYSLENGFNSLRIYFKTLGILAIIFISIGLLLLLLTQGIQS